MKIVSLESEEVFNQELRQKIVIEVGCKYVYSVNKPTNKRDRKFNGRIVEVLGFNDNFCGEAIVRYLDNNKQGKVNPCILKPYEIIFINYD